MQKKGLTIIELVVVIVVVAILAALGFTQYNRMIEKGRTAEAKAILSLVRTAEHAYKQQYGSYTSSVSLLGLENLVTTCTSTHYYTYSIDAVKGSAARCTSGGKQPDAGVYSITLDYDTGTFSGDAPYY